MKSTSLLAPLALALLFGCETGDRTAAERQAPLTIIQPNATMSFANAGHRVENWTVRTDGSLLIRSSVGNYYHATFMGTCPGLETEPQIGFKANATGDLDKFSSITLPHNRTCQFSTFDEVADPRGATAPPR